MAQVGKQTKDIDVAQLTVRHDGGLNIGDGAQGVKLREVLIIGTNDSITELLGKVVTSPAVVGEKSPWFWVSVTAGVVFSGVAALYWIHRITKQPKKSKP